MKLTVKEKALIVQCLHKSVEDNEVVLIDFGHNEFIRGRAHARIMELQELIKKVEDDIRTI
jgi:hypothetical protein